MFRITAMDMQDRLLRQVGGTSEPQMVSDIRTAIRSAMRLVSTEHAWPYYFDYYHLVTNETYATGTISYVASTRTVTLSGGTWPSWAAYGSVIIDTLHARVDAVTSSTVLTVVSEDAPPDDYSGTYTIYQYRFLLPVGLNIYKIGKIKVDQGNWMEYVPPGIFETDVRRQYLVSGGRPAYFTVSRDFRGTGQQVLSLWPYPTTEMRLRFGYVRHPADIAIWDYQTGRVASTASSTTVTGTSTAFTSNMAGCLIRTGNGIVNVPTDQDGLYPPVNEAVIDSVTNAASLVTKTAMTTTQTEASVSISSLLDVDYNTMLEVIYYRARLELAKIRRVDPVLRAEYERDYGNALYYAKAASSPQDGVSVAGQFTNRGWTWPGLWDSYYVLG